MGFRFCSSNMSLLLYLYDAEPVNIWYVPTWMCCIVLHSPTSTSTEDRSSQSKQPCNKYICLTQRLFCWCLFSFKGMFISVLPLFGSGNTTWMAPARHLASARLASNMPAKTCRCLVRRVLDVFCVQCSSNQTLLGPGICFSWSSPMSGSPFASCHRLRRLDQLSTSDFTIFTKEPNNLHCQCLPHFTETNFSQPLWKLEALGNQESHPIHPITLSLEQTRYAEWHETYWNTLKHINITYWNICHWNIMKQWNCDYLWLVTLRSRGFTATPKPLPWASMERSQKSSPDVPQ